MSDSFDCLYHLACTPLFLAAAYGHLDILKCLVESGADINACSDDHCTPLMVAIETKHIDIATFLIENGANVDLINNHGCTALHYALFYHCDSLFSRLIELKADVNGCNNNMEPNNSLTPLMLASSCCRVDAMKLLIKHGANVNLKHKEGKTALHYAVDSSVVSFEVLFCLIENGADLNAVLNDGRTPLMKAILNGKRTSIACFLTVFGGNIDLQDKEGNTALHHAVRLDSLKIVDCLLKFGASFNLYNNQGLTPLLLASDRGNIEVVEGIIKERKTTKEQRIEALELLGASIYIMKLPCFVDYHKIELSYIKRGMEERFSDPNHPFLKPPMKPGEKKECQTQEELAHIGNDRDAVVIESIIIRERITHNKSRELLDHVFPAAELSPRTFDFSTKTELYRHGVKMIQSSHKSAVYWLDGMSRMLQEEFIRSGSPKATNHVELLELTLLEYERQHEVTYLPSSDEEYAPSELFDIFIKAVLFIAKVNCSGERKTQRESTLLEKLRRKDPTKVATSLQWPLLSIFKQSTLKNLG